MRPSRPIPARSPRWRRSWSRPTRCSESSATSSIIECTVNHKYYEDNGYYVIGVRHRARVLRHVQLRRRSTWARATASTGATQYLIREGVEKLVLVQSKVPGTELHRGRLPGHRQGRRASRPRASRRTCRSRTRTQSALKAVQAAGEGGGVVLNFTPAGGAEDPPGRAAAGPPGSRQVGVLHPVQHRLPGGCAGRRRCDDKLGVNAELTSSAIDAPDTNLYRTVLKKYAPDIPLGSFSQIGFLEARIATEALLGVEGDVNKESVNEAFKNVEGLRDRHALQAVLLRRGAAAHPEQHGLSPYHPKDGVMVEKEGCFEISDVGRDDQAGPRHRGEGSSLGS